MKAFGWPDAPLIQKQQRKTGKLRTRLRRKKWEENPHCYYCGCKLEWCETTLDHVIPKSKGGPLTEDNTVLSCGICNVKKGDSTLPV